MTRTSHEPSVEEEITSLETLITVLGFVLVSAAIMAWHVRLTERDVATRRCPRCRATAGATAMQCAKCGVPFQAYELVTAPVASGPAEARGPLHALVRADVCVGCGACVSVCPEVGAIWMEGKIAVVDAGRCRAHGDCVRACPVNGIVLASGAAVHRVEAPHVDVHFQSNVRGLYVVGELGGRGLIKNAVNEGKIAAEHIARTLSGAERFTRALDGGERDGVFDVAIVGSGPAGLSAALEARRAGLEAVVLEQGDLSDTIHRYPRHKVLLAEPVRMPLYGDLWVADASKESLLGVWQTIIQQTAIDVRTRHRVLDVRHDGTGFCVATESEVFRARRVVLAMGRRGTPRQLGVAGEDLPHVFYDIFEMEAFQGKRILVVGGGDSAIESVVGLARQKGTQVTLSYRGKKLTRVRDRNRKHLDEAVLEGGIEIVVESHVREIRAGAVVLETATGAREIGNDFVIVRIGGDPPFEFLKRTGVEIVTKELALTEPTAVAA